MTRELKASWQQPAWLFFCFFKTNLSPGFLAEGNRFLHINGKENNWIIYYLFSAAFPTNRLVMFLETEKLFVSGFYDQHPSFQSAEQLQRHATPVSAIKYLRTSSSQRLINFGKPSGAFFGLFVCQWNYRSVHLKLPLKGIFNFWTILYCFFIIVPLMAEVSIILKYFLLFLLIHSDNCLRFQVVVWLISLCVFSTN